VLNWNKFIKYIKIYQNNIYYYIHLLLCITIYIIYIVDIYYNFYFYYFYYLQLYIVINNIIKYFWNYK